MKSHGTHLHRTTRGGGAKKHVGPQVAPAQQPDVAAQVANARNVGHRLEDVSATSNDVDATPMRVGPADDAYEQQADRLAEKIVNDLHGSEDAGESRETVTPVTRNVAAPSLQRQASTTSDQGGMAAPETAMQIEAAADSGEQVPARIRRSAESVLGARLGDVKIHRDGRANALNQSLNSSAFAVGNHLFVRPESFDPDSETGEHLLSHELVHTAQQTNSPTDGAKTIQRAGGDDKQPDRGKGKKKVKETDADETGASDSNSASHSSAAPLPAQGTSFAEGAGMVMGKQLPIAPRPTRAKLQQGAQMIRGNMPLSIVRPPRRQGQRQAPVAGAVDAASNNNDNIYEDASAALAAGTTTTTTNNNIYEDPSAALEAGTANSNNNSNDDLPPFGGIWRDEQEEGDD